MLRAYERLCRKLAAVGLPRNPHEGAEDYAARVAQLRPDLAAAVTGLCRRYTQLRYGAPSERRRVSFPPCANFIRGAVRPTVIGARR